MKLGDLIDVWECSDSHPPDDDTTMIRKIGDRETVGKVVEEKERGDIRNLNSYLCIKPKNNDELLPKYLYYSMMYVQSTGHWKRHGIPYSSDKLKIRVSDVKKVTVKRT